MGAEAARDLSVRDEGACDSADERESGNLAFERLGLDANKLKMLALALDAGIASRSTFNDVLKKHANQTPSAFQTAAGALRSHAL